MNIDSRPHQLLKKDRFKNLKSWIDQVNIFRTPGKLGEIDLAPEPGTMERELHDYFNALENYVPSFSTKPQDPLKLKERERKKRRQERLGIVGNNLADLPRWRQDPEQKSGFKSEKPERQQSYKIQKAIRKHKLAYKNVHQCGIYPVENNNVAIHRNAEHKNCSTKGLKTCGSVWACPVCRRKIMSRRADQIKEMARHWKSEGGEIYMLTFTVPHNKKDSLARIYGSSNEGTGLSGAMSKFRSWYCFSKKFKNAIDYFGDLRTVEVTHGKNGWHCHIHMLVFCRDKIASLEQWEARLLKKWKKACAGAGLKEPSERGLSIDYIGDREAGQFSGYLAKWGAPGEMSSQYAKTAKNGNLTLAELEKCLIDDFYRSWKGISLNRAVSLLSIYYATMKGQKMMQLGGCKKGHSWKENILEQIEQSDQELMQQDQDAEQEFPGEDIAEIHPAAFEEIAKRGLTFRLLDYAESQGYQGIRKFMKSQGFEGATYRPQALKYVLERLHLLNWPEIAPG